MARMDVSSRETVEFAAQGGQPDALFELGLSCSTGRDGTVDLIQATSGSTSPPCEATTTRSVTVSKLRAT